MYEKTYDDWFKNKHNLTNTQMIMMKEVSKKKIINVNRNSGLKLYKNIAETRIKLLKKCK